MTTLRERIATGRPLLGSLVQWPSEALVETLGCAGFDFVIMDMEHGSLDIPRVERLVRAAEVRGMSKMVRVWKGDPAIVARAVDTGADGLVFPAIATAEEAERHVAWARLPPVGHRGMCQITRAGDYSGMTLGDYHARTNDLVLAVYIETRQALDNVEEILEVPGVDLVMVGIVDLAADLRLDMTTWPPPELRAAHERVAAAAAKTHTTLMEFAATPEQIAESRSRGAQVTLYGSDASIVTDACRAIVARYRVSVSATP